jgi:plastocyanin
VISVPVGYTVNVTFSNNGGAPHSAVVTLYSKRMSVGSFPLAFHGAGSPNPMSGIGKGKTQRFSFVANKVGKYALVCAVPSHAALGMWDVFQVTRGGKATISGVQGVGPRA